jgi:hypothetical protein
MSSDSLAPAAPRQASPARRAWVAFAVFCCATALCLVGYLSLTAHGRWIGGATPKRWSAADLSVPRGTARLGKDGLTLLAADATDTVVISLDTAFRSADYPVIAWRAVNVPDDVRAALAWYSDYKASRMSTRALVVEGGQIAPVDLGSDPDWIGNIRGLALVLQGHITQPVFVRGVIAKSMTPREILTDRAREWLAFEPWNGASINTVVGGADVQELPLPALLATIAMLGSLIYAVLSRWAPAAVGTFRPEVVGYVFLAAWLLLDARWQWNLARQVALTYNRYEGKSWQERHFAAEDGELFAFIERVREQLPPVSEQRTRVFMVADANYFRDRGAYHLYPYNVYFDPWQDTMPPASALRPGDYLVVYRRAGVQYEPAERQLRWNGGGPLGADLLFADAGAALFRIR